MNRINTETKVQDYGTIFTALQQIAPHAHIAGGAVRDTLLSREIRDIDVFLDDAHADDAAKLLRANFGYVKVGEWRQYEIFSDPIVARVAKFEKADEIIPVCLIGLKEDYTAKENIGRFDFGICMAAWEGGASMITTDEFKYDAEARTFTLTRADNHAQFAYSMVRFKKLSADRYAGWTLSVPGQFEGLARDYAFSKAWYTHQDIHDSPFGVVFESPQVLRPRALMPAAPLPAPAGAVAFHDQQTNESVMLDRTLDTIRTTRVDAEIREFIEDAVASSLSVRTAAAAILRRINGATTHEQLVAVTLDLLREQKKRHTAVVAYLTDNVFELEDKISDLEVEIEHLRAKLADRKGATS